jgi:opacity protein-like surface antigen
MGVFGGVVQDQEAQIDTGRSVASASGSNSEPIQYNVMRQDGAAVFGLEIGHSWRMKKAPLEFALEFEGLYTSSEFSARIQDRFANGVNPGDPGAGDNEAFDAADGDIGLVETDLNSAVFMFNGMAVLDLRKYRPRIGKIPTGFRPYIGGGVGGAQMWFRNTTVGSVEEVREDNLRAPTDPPVVFGNESLDEGIDEPFNEDQFVFVYQVFGGLEYNFNDKVSLYAEYRRITYEKFDLVRELNMDVVSGGIHFRY